MKKIKCSRPRYSRERGARTIARGWWQESVRTSVRRVRHFAPTGSSKKLVTECRSKIPGGRPWQAWLRGCAAWQRHAQRTLRFAGLRHGAFATRFSRRYLEYHSPFEMHVTCRPHAIPPCIRIEHCHSPFHKPPHSHHSQISRALRTRSPASPRACRQWRCSGRSKRSGSRCSRRRRASCTSRATSLPPTRTRRRR